MRRSICYVATLALLFSSVVSSANAEGSTDEQQVSSSGHSHQYGFGGQYADDVVQLQPGAVVLDPTSTHSRTLMVPPGYYLDCGQYNRYAMRSNQSGTCTVEKKPSWVDVGVGVGVLGAVIYGLSRIHPRHY